MKASVFSVFRESLYFLSSCAGGHSFAFSNERNESLIRSAAELAGLRQEALSEYKKLESIFCAIDPASPKQFAIQDENGLFGGFDKEADFDMQSSLNRWDSESKLIPAEESYAQALLELFEDCFSAAPSNLEAVSIWHLGKITAAIACAIAAGGGTDADPEKPFVLYSVDLSGIQSFIYTIISAGALRALKTRSLYLSILTEHVSDLILKSCGLPRCNLIYAGGGRAHLLLSSDPEMTVKADRAVKAVNIFLRRNFGTSLYLASGWIKASRSDLNSNDGTTPSFSELFRSTSRSISTKKLRRYSYEEICELNSEPMDREGRKCSICGRSSSLSVWKDDKCLCRTCRQMESFVNTMEDSCRILSVLEGEAEGGLPLPGADGEKYTLIANEDPAVHTVWRYTINNSIRNRPGNIRISLSVHRAARRANGSPATFKDMASASVGIPRLGVFRGDVDSLGQLLAKGFVRPNESKPWTRCTMSYYSALSGALTWFFQNHLDSVIEQNPGSSLLQARAHGENTMVIYAGGDDVFLIGAWNEVLDAGLKLQEAFLRYSGGAVTLSGGYSLFPEHTPVPLMADSTADLEEVAKQAKGKNSIALFGRDSIHDQMVQCYPWETFRSNVLSEKMETMLRFFSSMEDKGNSFLYHILLLFREMATDPMAISRLAYLLARHLPSEHRGASPEKVAQYREFMKNVYHWALEPHENLAFRTACLIYVYLNRNQNEN